MIKASLQVAWGVVLSWGLQLPGCGNSENPGDSQRGAGGVGTESSTGGLGTSGDSAENGDGDLLDLIPEHEPERPCPLQQWHCEDPATRQDCSCQFDAPLEAWDCPEPWQFHCRFGTATPEAEVAGKVWGLDPGRVAPNEDCWCNSDAPRSAEDCAKPEDFWCAERGTARQACYCRADSPTLPEDCENPDRFRCQWVEKEASGMGGVQETLIGCDCTGLLVEECRCPHCYSTCLQPSRRPLCECDNAGH